jgi:hypothetical protein
LVTQTTRQSSRNPPKYNAVCDSIPERFDCNVSRKGTSVLQPEMPAPYPL